MRGLTFWHALPGFFLCEGCESFKCPWPGVSTDLLPAFFKEKQCRKRLHSILFHQAALLGAIHSGKFDVAYFATPCRPELIPYRRQLFAVAAPPMNHDSKCKIHQSKGSRHRRTVATVNGGRGGNIRGEKFDKRRSATESGCHGVSSECLHAGGVHRARSRCDEQERRTHLTLENGRVGGRGAFVRTT